MKCPGRGLGGWKKVSYLRLRVGAVTFTWAFLWRSWRGLEGRQPWQVGQEPSVSGAVVWESIGCVPGTARALLPGAGFVSD